MVVMSEMCPMCKYSVLGREVYKEWGCCIWEGDMYMHSNKCSIQYIRTSWETR